MSTEVSIPRLSMSMTEGTLSEWLVSSGDEVAAGTPLYVIETDKVESEIESPVAGRVTLLAEAGETLEVGAVIARIE
jgi:pyruvate/2-oxoglutarate dehydrogenase complex dihydrolipoamide acyltransferase (E2) component